MTAGRHTLWLSGYAPALPTPFHETGKLDGTALEWLCHRQIEDGASALVVCGTSAEAPTLSRAEHDTIVRIAVGTSRLRIPVIADASSNSTSQAIELAKDAEAAGADGILSVVPYYNKPTQAGMYAHFRAVVEATGLPVILYDIPSRTVCGLADDTVARLAELPRVIGLKDATGDLSSPGAVAARRTTKRTKADIEKVLARIATEHSGYMIGDVRRPDRYRVQSMEPARAKARFAMVPGAG